MREFNHDVFISYSTKDSTILEIIHKQLEEKHNIKCWFAPRDIPPGDKYSDIIPDAIKASKAIILIFSSNAQNSQYVEAEIDIAYAEKKRIFPFKIDNCELNNSMRIFLGRSQWIDAGPNVLDVALKELSSYVKVFLQPTNSTKSYKKVEKKVEIDSEHIHKEEWFRKKAFLWIKIGLGVAIITVLLFILYSRESKNDTFQIEDIRKNGEATGEVSVIVGPANVRTTPGIEKGKVAFIVKEGERLPYYGYIKDQAGRTWFRLKDTKTGQDLWISSLTVKIVGKKN